MVCELVTAPDNKTQTVDLCSIGGSEGQQHSPEGQLVEHLVGVGVFETWRSWRKADTQQPKLILLFPRSPAIGKLNRVIFYTVTRNH
jgi:hypothetical protein